MKSFGAACPVYLESFIAPIAISVENRIGNLVTGLFVVHKPVTSRFSVIIDAQVLRSWLASSLLRPITDSLIIGFFRLQFLHQILLLSGGDDVEIRREDVEQV